MGDRLVGCVLMMLGISFSRNGDITGNCRIDWMLADEAQMY